MFTKKRIIITVISAVLVAALAVGAVFIVGGLSEKKRVTEFEKNDKTSVTLKVNGKDMTFEYDPSEKRENAIIYNADGETTDINQDFFLSQEGYKLTKFEGADSFFALSLKDYTPKITPEISEQEASDLAYEIASNTDIVPDELLSGSKLTRDVRRRYSVYDVTFSNDKGSVHVSLELSGELISLRIQERDTSRIPKSKKAEALAMVKEFIEERNAVSEGLHVLDTEEYIMAGDRLIALYGIIHYSDPSDPPNPMTDPHMAYTANFIV